MRTLDEIRAMCQRRAVIQELRQRYGSKDAQTVIAGVFREAAGIEEKRMARSLAKQVKGLGETGALELLGRIGMLLADEPINPEVSDA